MQKILGIDFGTKRIGLAISDELGLTAQGLDALERKSLKKDMVAIKEIIKENEVNKIVVGLPLDRDGNLDKSSLVLDFIEKLKDNFKLPIETWDERFSSLEVEKVLLSADIRRRERKRKIDKLAAQIILQGYLDYINQVKPQPHPLSKEI